jgi:hypothetical protein
MYGPSPAERIAMARRLIGRNKLTEALDILNEAIRQDPRYPDTYEARAEVFGQMGMYPHAQADRRKAADIRATQAPAPPPPTVPPEAVPEEPPAAQAEAETEAGEPDAVAKVLEEAGVNEPPPVPPPTAPPESEPVYQQAPPSMPAYAGPPRPTVSGAILRAAAVVFFALGIFIAAGVGIYLALDAVNGDDDATAAATATPTTLDSATENAGGNDDGSVEDDGEPRTVEDALRGDPYGFSSVESAFKSAGFTVTTGDFSEAVAGFSEDAVDMTIEKDGLTMETSILMYDSSDAPGEEWALGTPTTPKGDGIVPVGSSVWYNRNVILVIRVNDGTLRPDALEAFLDIG